MPATVPFHVEVEKMKMKMVGLNVAPMMMKMMDLLPDKTRQAFSTKQHAPNLSASPLDKWDCLKESPYETKELVEGKLWKVTYAMEDKGLTDATAKKKAKSFGMDWTQPDVKAMVLAGAASEGEKAVEIAKKDLEEVEKLWNKTEYSLEEKFTLMQPSVVSMLVVKLNSGGLLLYAPTRVRDEAGFAEWLNSLGKVEYLVVASSFHTLSLPAVLARYPEAVVIGAPQAEAKLNHVNALVRKQLDYNSFDSESLQNVNSTLEKEGVKIVPVPGDLLTNVTMVIAHGFILTCDLLYTLDEGECMGVSNEEWLEFKDKHRMLRLFKFLNINKPNSPNGHLAKYRFMFMDHTGMGLMGYDKPAKDGSTCSTMATSLRGVLKEDFTSAAGVHAGVMNREKFRKSIDVTWKWLDGKPLL